MGVVAVVVLGLATMETAMEEMEAAMEVFDLILMEEEECQIRAQQ